MFKKITSTFAIVLLLVSMSGCIGTVNDLDTDRGPRVFGGIQTDIDKIVGPGSWNGWKGSGVSIAHVFDLPSSFFWDILMLPFSIYKRVSN